MKLSPREQDSLLIHQAGNVAQKRLARGCRLNYPEAVALLSCQIQEFARDGETVSQIMAKGKKILGKKQVMSGVEYMIEIVQVEATFPDGTKLVTFDHPISRQHGDLSLALYGSFLPVPDEDLFNKEDDKKEAESGDMKYCEGHDIPINVGKKRITVEVTNMCDRPIQVGSHYHFIELNKHFIFDREKAYGMRLDIPAGQFLRFEPGQTRLATLVEIGGNKIVKGGNSISDGVISPDNLSKAMEKIRRGNFGNAIQNQTFPADPYVMSRFLYVYMYGPTVGDKVILGDTQLVVKVEKDFTTYGEECIFGGGKVIRDGMGQSSTMHSSTEELDLVLTNCLIIDAIQGIVKADVGIKGTIIVGIGKSGNSDVMDNVTAGMTVGAATEVLSGETLILTAGGIDTHIHFVCPQLIEEALASGLTTLLGGGVGCTTSTRATTCTSGPDNIRFMIQSTDCFPINLGFSGKGSISQSEGLSNVLREQIEAGAIGLKIHEDWGSTPSVIDSCLRVADAYDIQVFIHTDSMNESACVEETIETIAGRTIHTYHTEGAGGGHAPDILRVCSELCCLPSSTNPTRPYTRNTIEEHLDMMFVCHNLNRNLKEDLAFVESRIRAETIAAEDVLNDMGAISMISSDSQAMGRVAEVISRTWQTADKMKRCRGSLPEDDAECDNHRVKRYIAKYTINPAIAHGISHIVGSLEVGKMADMVLWHPAFFGVKPNVIIKGGKIVYSEMGTPNASIPTVEPVRYRKNFGAYGKSAQNLACVFVSQLSFENGIIQKYGIEKKIVPVRRCRDITKKDMILNDALPKLKVNPETFRVYCAETVDGEEVWVHLTSPMSERVPLAQKYFLF